MKRSYVRAIALALALCMMLPFAAFAAESESSVMHNIIISIDASADKQALLDRLCEKYDLSVVYKYGSMNIAALRSNTALTAAGLQKLLEDLAAENGVLSAEPDRVIELDPREWEGFDKPVSDAPVTRAQAIAELWKLAGRPIVNHILPFSDVAQEADYAEAVRWAVAEGITAGTGNGCFSPDQPVTRQQLAAMLYAYVKTQGKGFTGMWMFLLQAEDRADIAEYAYEPFCWLTMNGVLKTDASEMLRPAGTVTEEELQRILTDLKGILCTAK